MKKVVNLDGIVGKTVAKAEERWVNVAITFTDDSLLYITPGTDDDGDPIVSIAQDIGDIPSCQRSDLGLDVVAWNRRLVDHAQLALDKALLDLNAALRDSGLREEK